MRLPNYFVQGAVECTAPEAVRILGQVLRADVKQL
jgi:hypothetical protein